MNLQFQIYYMHTIYAKWRSIYELRLRSDFMFSAWSRIVRVGAIDCAETQHRPLCIRYNVNGYPTVKYIPQGSSAQQLGYRYTGEETSQRLAEATIDYIKATATGGHVPNTDPVR